MCRALLTSGHPWGHGAHLTVLWDADHPDGVTDIVILRWFPPAPTVETGPPLAELPSYLDDRRIGILPVGNYSDWIWEKKMAINSTGLFDFAEFLLIPESQWSTQACNLTKTLGGACLADAGAVAP